MADRPLRPTEKNLERYAVEPLARWLITAAHEHGQVRYGEAKQWLEDHHGFQKIFPAMMGKPAGHLIDQLKAVDSGVPLLNVLLVRQSTELPGEGADPFLAERFKEDRLREPSARGRYPALWQEIFVKAVDEVYRYQRWEEIFEKAFSKPFSPDPDFQSHRATEGGRESDGLNFGREGEGPNHKALRLWVMNNPRQVLGRGRRIDRVETEHVIKSGDRIDVVVFSGSKTIAIEVKSRDSNQVDIERGVFQCVKYEAVLRAMDARPNPDVEAWLLTENPVNGALGERIRQLKIRHIQFRRPD